MPCPNCLMLCEKTSDEDCDHVKCMCGTEFCIACSAKRSPIMAHGNQYHRKKCNAYFAYSGIDNMYSNECTECVKLGKICTPPNDLDSTGDIPVEERSPIKVLPTK